MHYLAYMATCLSGISSQIVFCQFYGQKNCQMLSPGCHKPSAGAICVLMYAQVEKYSPPTWAHDLKCIPTSFVKVCPLWCICQERVWTVYHLEFGAFIILPRKTSLSGRLTLPSIITDCYRGATALSPLCVTV